MLKHQHLVAAPRMLPCCLAATNPAAQIEKLLFFFCASSLTSRDGGSWVLTGGAVEFWVRAQPLAVAGFALAVVCQFGFCDILTTFPSHLPSLWALATDANSAAMSHTSTSPFGYTLVFIKQIIHQKHLSIFNAAPRPTHTRTYIFASWLVQYSLSFFPGRCRSSSHSRRDCFCISQRSSKNPRELQSVSL